MKCDIEIFFNNQWRPVASFELLQETAKAQGYLGKGHFEYNPAYALEHLDSTGHVAVSCCYPVNFEIHRTESWPAFLLDILPSGANRRYWLRHLSLADGPEADWQLLLAGGGNPTGNLRIAQASHSAPMPRHNGFSRQEVLERAELFIEYAMEHGAPVAGSTGAQGDAPKFLLTQDKEGNFHADGALSDHLAVKHWLVKFPRGKQESDRAILRNENNYYRVAALAGLRVGEELSFESNTLFVPRFDRSPCQGKVIRLGLESLCSAAGVTGFGMTIPQETLCHVLATYSSKPQDDIREFIFRDILNVALGNTDNHARNSSLIKYQDGTVRLAPLYDFAPMFLDDQGIPRTCRWQNETLGMPAWGDVAEGLKHLGVNPDTMRNEINQFAKTIHRLPEIMKEACVEEWLIERLHYRITETVQSLDDVQ